MAPQCVADTMECIYNRVISRHKRDIPPPPVTVVSTPSDDPSSSVTSTDHVLIISVAASGSLLLVIATILFFVCLKRKRAARRIGERQELSPAFMDEKSTEEYFKDQTTTVTAASALVPSPSKAHHRTRSVPNMFGGGERNDQNSNGIGTEGKDQFHQISLEEEGKGETGLKKSLSRGFSRFRSSTVAVPTTTLHRSVSLNIHGLSGYISRSAPIEEEAPQDPSDTDALPTATRLVTSEGQRKSSISREYGPRRFSGSMNYQTYSKSSSSAVEFDPSQFTNTSAVPDPKRPSNRPSVTSSDESGDDDTASTASSDGFDHLPPHQMHQNFESHNPYPGGEKQGTDESQELQNVTSHGSSQQVTCSSPMATQTRTPQGIAFQTIAPPLSSRIIHQEGQDLHIAASDAVDAEAKQQTP
ncbi:hypothetical protein BGZ65_007289 [Modicella reniformis]|uniref:Uncharacterized protein n=1 Tax=Modicella reniformis TaxID=1440133 RepID=A0A9P6SVJ4_9FUNG|nr:hypothetical protein BGZ65_007289 [Modicella reniformis]